VPVAIVLPLAMVLIARGADLVRAVMRRNPVVVTALVGALVGALAVAYRALADRPVDDVLFSGEQALPDYATIAGAGTLLLLAFVKAVGYTASLGARLEGGPIFPSIAIGGAAGLAAAQVLPGASTVPMVAVGIAAAATVLQRLPVFGVTFSLIVIGSQHTLEATLFCIIGALVGWVIASAMQPAATHAEAPSRGNAAVASGVSDAPMSAS
jgi:H+/Cl- antiporter ClcA